MDLNKLIVTVAILLIVVMIIIMLFSHNNKITIKGSTFNAPVNIDQSTHNKVVTQVTTNNYVSTGVPPTNRDDRVWFAKAANVILQLPEKISDFISSLFNNNNKNSNDDVGEIILFLIGGFVLLIIAIVASALAFRLLTIITLLLTGISVVYYAILVLIHKEVINKWVFIIQAVTPIQILFLNLPLTAEATNVQQNSELNFQTVQHWVEIGKNITTHPEQITSIIWMLMASLFLYFKVYTILTTLAERRTLNKKSVFMSFVGTIFLILILQNVNTWYSFIVNLPNMFSNGF